MASTNRLYVLKFLICCVIGHVPAIKRIMDMTSESCVWAWVSEK
jgi:hypothetical protein